MSTIRAQLKRAETFLQEDAKLEAEILLAHVLQKPRSYLHAWPEDKLSVETIALFDSYVNRRVLQEPIAYIIGSREFWSLNLTVTADTLIPRPETELIIETVLSLYANHESLKIADLGTGSGAIALALGHERPTWKIVATDVSEHALLVAEKNARACNVDNVTFAQGSWCEALNVADFNVIVSNPPYIAENEWDSYAQGLAFEPKAALLSGQDGLDAIRIISSSARNHLLSGGCLVIEHGFKQAPLIREILQIDGYTKVQSVGDLLNYERVTLGYCFR